MLKKLKPLKFGAILIISIILTLGFSISLQSLLAAWTAPASVPPTNNIADFIVGGNLGVVNNSLVMGNLTASGTKMALFANTTTGNVGIGTTTLNSRLTIDGGASFSNGLIRFDGQEIMHTPANPFYINSNNTIQFRFNANGGAGEFGINQGIANSRLFTIRDTGNVGINTINPNLKLHVDTGNTSNGAILLTKSPSTPAFSVLPWSSNIYISAGIYYKNGTWVQQSDTGDNLLLTLDPGVGVLWYASNNGTGSWNVASGKQLWDAAGTWKSGVDTVNNVKAAKMQSDNYCDAAGNNCKAITAIGGGGGGSQTFTTSGTFTVPVEVNRVFVDVYSGGGGGGGGGYSYFSFNPGGSGGGGAAGAESHWFSCVVVPGSNITVTVGAGGSGGAGLAPYYAGTYTAAAGTNGGASSFGSCITLAGGMRGTGGSSTNKGVGGTVPYPAVDAGAGGNGGISGEIEVSVTASVAGGRTLRFLGGAFGTTDVTGYGAVGGGGGGASSIAAGGAGGYGKWSSKGGNGASGGVAAGGGGGGSGNPNPGYGGGKGGNGGSGKVVVYW